MRMAYLILAHEDPLQLKALAEELTKTSDIYIHINQRSNITPFINALSEIDHRDRVTFITNRHKIRWAGYSIVEATFELIEAALSHAHYDRIILMTGLDYPIKSGQEIRRFYEDNRDINFVCAKTLDSQIHPRLKYYFCYDWRILHLLLRLIRMLHRDFLKRKENIDFIEYRGKKFVYRGNAPMWAITGECAQYLLAFYKDNPEFNNIFRHVHAPDDLYVATVLYASSLRATLNTGGGGGTIFSKLDRNKNI